MFHNPPPGIRTATLMLAISLFTRFSARQTLKFFTTFLLKNENFNPTIAKKLCIRISHLVFKVGIQPIGFQQDGIFNFCMPRDMVYILSPVLAFNQILSDRKKRQVSVKVEFNGSICFLFEFSPIRF